MGDESEHGIAAQMQRHQAVVFDAAPQQGNVGLVTEQPLQDLIGIGGFNLHIDTGVTAAEARDIGQDVHRRIHGKVQGPGRQGAVVREHVVGIDTDIEQALGQAEQPLAHLRQAHQALVAVEHHHPVIILELAHLVGYRRLRQAELLGRPGEAAIHGDGVKRLELGMGNRHWRTLL
ncbi:hypothetical protein D3C81_1003620 [compost metagenome]